MKRLTLTSRFHDLKTGKCLLLELSVELFSHANQSTVTAVPTHSTCTRRNSNADAICFNPMNTESLQPVEQRTNFVFKCTF
jgi:hypothetical protein